MSSAYLEIQIIAVIVAIACALPGVMLVLRKMSLMSDAISHAILLGIVLAFFIVKDLGSPFLIIGAASTGLLLVFFVELFAKTKLVSEDSAIGLIFPAMFSLGVILISKFAGNIHLDVDAVLLGELAYAPFDRMVIFGIDIGARAIYIMGIILVINLLFIIIFYKELKLTSFDPGLAVTLGFLPTLMHYLLMSLVSVTAVGAFDAVGSVLVVAFMIVPAIGAYLLTDKLSLILLLSVAIAVASAVSGFWISFFFDTSIAGTMATMTGIIFIIIFIFAPERGLIAIIQRKIKQKWDFAQDLLMIHLLNHSDTPEALEECNLDTIHKHFNWDQNFTQQVIFKAMKKGKIFQKIMLNLSDEGKEIAKKAMTR